MQTHPGRVHRAVPIVLGGATLAGVTALLAWDAFPQLFPEQAHNLLAALPLTLIAVAFVLYATPRRQRPSDLIKAIILSAAFLFWAANQLWPKSPHATLFNDIAIALFVFDVFLVIIGWPATGSPGAAAIGQQRQAD